MKGISSEERAEQESDVYKQKVKAQIRQFQNTQALWKLPPIYHYWMKAHILPRIHEVMECSHARTFYVQNICSINRLSLKIVSIGSGDCFLEMSIAEDLLNSGLEDFTIECLELSKIRLERAKTLAITKGLEDYFLFRECDINNWKAESTYDVAIAHHSLHHIVALEQLFSTLKQNLAQDGLFLTIDMIGRNGHMRWPEALEIIEGLWSIIPDHYKFNYQFNKYHNNFVNWDCSGSGFEGIRAQDILPLLVKTFNFKNFLGYGNIIDPFIERGYGHNLNPDNPKDTAFIDFVETLNVKMIDAGILKPTMIFAAMGHQNFITKCFHHWTPEYCVRKTNL